MRSNLTVEQVQGLKLLGTFNNNWRQRRVEVREHPDNPDMVVSVGYPFNGGDPLICEEEREDYITQLKYGNWGDYN